MSARIRAYLLLFIASAIWGIAGPVIKYTLEFIPPGIFLFYRFAIAGIFAVITLSFFKASWPKSNSQKFWIFLYCFLNTTVVLGLLFLGYAKTSAITGSLINAVYPVIVAVVGVFFLKEHVTHREKLGIGITLTGVGLTIINLNSIAFEGNLLVLASLIVGVISAVMAKLLLRKNLSPFALTQLSFLIGLITTTPIVLYFYPPLSIVQSLISVPLSVHAGVWYMALLSGTLAYSLWHIGQKSIEIGETALFSYLYPIFVIPLSFFWLHEQITWVHWTSAAIIATGVFIAQTKPRISPPAGHQ